MRGARSLRTCAQAQISSVSCAWRVECLVLGGTCSLRMCAEAQISSVPCAWRARCLVYALAAGGTPAQAPGWRQRQPVTETVP